jgi:hypothetical protein
MSRGFYAGFDRRREFYVARLKAAEMVYLASRATGAVVETTFAAYLEMPPHTGPCFLTREEAEAYLSRRRAMLRGMP